MQCQPSSVTTALLAWATLSTALPAGAAVDRATLVSMGASVLRVEAPTGRGGYALGSAVALAPETVVTNCHVTRESGKIYVVRHGVRHTATAQASDIEHDLCLLKVPGLEAQVVPLGTTSSLAVGQSVTAIGFTGGIGLQASDGLIVGLHRHDGGRVVQSDNWFSSGASGGGLFDDAGRLVGILTFRLRGGDAHYFSAPVEWAQFMLSSAKPTTFDTIAPLAATPRAFWQGSPAEQPPYLRAAYLEQVARWSELETMAADWSRADPDNAHPWYWLGTALERRDRVGDARRAFACSLSLDPSYAAARVRMAALAMHVPEPTAGAAPQLAPNCPVTTARP